MRIILCMIAVLFPCWLGAAPLPHDERVPGGVAVLPLPVSGDTAPQVHMNATRIMTLSHDGQWFAVVGIPLDAAPGEMTVQAAAGAATPVPISFSVAAKVYPEQRLTIPNSELVTPNPAEEQRIEREQQHLGKVFSVWRPVTSPEVNFIWPAQGPETSPFGVHRVLNGQSHGPHSGIDIGAPYGSPVHAPADGVVADAGNYYFCGKTLTLDMGQGLFSVYCHLSKIKVKVGQKVKQGETVGNIGRTGRTTGPNLHWTVRLNGTIVDPHAFLPASLGVPSARTAVSPGSSRPDDGVAPGHSP